MARITFEKALRTLGVVGFELRTRRDYDRLMGIWRDQTVAARRSNQDVIAAHLSQVKETIKKKYMSLKSKICPRCKQDKKIDEEYCPACTETLKGIPDDSASLYQVVDDQYIPAPANGGRGLSLLAASLQKLVQVGESFVSDKSPTTIGHAAKRLGLIVVVRKINIGETDKKKKRFQVWRTDGLKPSAVNAAIKARLDAAKHLNGPTTPEPPPADEVDRTMYRPTPRNNKPEPSEIDKRKLSRGAAQNFEAAETVGAGKG